METPRLFIREVCIDDLDALYRIYDKNVTKYVEKLYDDRREEAEFTAAYIKNMYGFYGYGLWVLQLKDGTVIGRAGISNRMVDGETEFEAGYVVGTGYQGKGYAFEAMEYIIKYAFEKLEAKSINCFIKEENIKSISLAVKLGFEMNGTVKSGDNEFIRYTKYKEKTDR